MPLRFKKNDVIIIGVIVFIPLVVMAAIEIISQGGRRNPTSWPVHEWKTALKHVGFKGAVKYVGGFYFSHRGLCLVGLENVIIQNEKFIPVDCELFVYKKGVLKFAAYSQNVKRWPDYGLEEGFIIEKKVDNDTLFVYSTKNNPKYVFELFDGLDTEWVPRQWPKN